jgi:hypothetical protein
MARTLIDTPNNLRRWLTDKPTYCAQAIAMRAASRALPLIVNSREFWLSSFALLPFGAVLTSWFQLADRSIFVRTEEGRANARFGGDSFDFGGYKMEHIAAWAADASYHSADAQSGSSWAASDCLEGVTKAADAFLSEPLSDTAPGFKPVSGEKAFWQSVAADCDWLSDKGNTEHAAQELALMQLWQTAQPTNWYRGWGVLVHQLRSIDPDYSVWIDWYERRIRGERAAFDIPGDKRRVEDKKILRRLAEATDEDFWSKGHEYVNATLTSWLDEARERAAQNFQPLSELDQLLTEPDPLDSINPDPQDARSPQFGLDPAGRIAIKPDGGADQLRSDPQSLSRHARARQAAQKLGDALRNHNNAGYITGMVDDYVAAMDWGDNGPDPSGLVFAGDQLREAIAKHRISGPDDDLQRLPPSADRDASAFVSAHNMYVGSDHFLDDLDRTTRGPDTPLPAADPDEIRQIATTARHDDILAAHSYDYMIDASNAAPATYDAADRHSRFAAGLAQNFARYGIEFVWTYPNEAAWASLASGVGVAVLLGPLAAAGGTVAGIGLAYHLARNMIANETTYQKLLATSPAGEDNFNRLMRFLKSLPVKSLKDD